MTDAFSLTPEALGVAGEDLFRSLCAGLTCNQSNRDVTGWDFRVELPFDDQNGITLDRRAPKVCQVQVKSTAGESGTRVTATLSALERLAKDTAPAAVFILRLRHDGEPLSGYVVHLIDKELGRILHRLRRAEAEGRRDLNKLTVTFDYTKARRFDLTRAGLRHALDEICGEDPTAYTERKQAQLANLGYGEGGGIEAEALVWIEGEDHLTRILSRLAPLKPIKVQAYDRRFDIRLPYTGPLLDGVKEFSLDLPHAGPCDIIMRRGPREPAALFKCEAYVPPPIGEGPWLVIRHPVLSVLFGPDGLNVETTGAFGESRKTLEEWRLLLRGLTYMASGSGTISLEFRGVRLPPVSIPENGLDGPYIEELPRLLDFVDQWAEALSLAGVSPAEPFALDDIWDAVPAHIALDILFNPKPVARMEFDVIDGAENQSTLDAVYFNTVGFAGVDVAFAVKASLARDAEGDSRFTSTGFELLDIRPAVADLKAYGAEIAGGHEVLILIDPEFIIFQTMSVEIPDEVQAPSA